jgi:PAS domain S-box-containing protein
MMSMTPDLLEVLEEISDAVVVVDERWVVTYVNSRGAQAVRAAPESLIGRELWERLPMLRGSEFETNLRRAMTQHLRVRFEAVVPLLDRALKVCALPTADGLCICIQDVTERRAAEQGLRDSERRMAAILDSAMDAIVGADAQQRVVVFNAAAERMFQCPAEEAVGKPLDTFIPTRYRAAHHQHVAGFGATGVTHRAMGRLGQVSGLRRDGTEFPIEASIAQVEVGGSKLYTAILRDITERVATEQALWRGNRELRAITACNQVLVRSTDEHSLLQEVCRIIVEVGGYRMAWVGFAEQDENNPITPIVWAGHEDGYLEQARHAPADHARGGAPSVAAIRSGRPQTCHDIAADPAFAPWRTLALERGYKACIALPLMTNSQAFGSLNIYAETAGEFAELEVGLLSGFAEDVAYGIMALRARAERRRAREELEEHQRNLERTVEARTSELRQSNKHLQQEITERAYVEKALRDSEAQLRAKNQQLETAILAEQDAYQVLGRAQEQLVLTEKLASLGQLVAGVAHEVNNPLSFVHNNMVVVQRDTAAICAALALYREADVELAQRDPELFGRIRDLCAKHDVAYAIANLSEILARSTDGLQRIRQIVKDLRDFSRSDERSPQEVDLNAGIASTLNIIRGQAHEHEVEVRLEPGPLDPVRCFPAKINQVVLNLVTNAIDACAPGGRVVVRTRSGAKDVEIEVEDNGRGMDPAVCGKIFDPFFTTKPQGRGMGLGLSISYGIVRDHGGRIEVQSTPGRGSRFTVSLPRRPAAAEPGPDAAGSG